MKKIKTYNEAVERLETIMTQINSGETDIDTLSEKLREAQELINYCRSKLYTVDEEIKSLLTDIESGEAEK